MICHPLVQGGSAGREQLQKPLELWAKLWKSSTHLGGAQGGGGRAQGERETMWGIIGPYQMD